MVTLILILVFGHYGSINQRREGKRIIKVGIIDGVSTDHIKFKIKKDLILAILKKLIIMLM